MKRTDPGFWLELSGKIGPPIFAGALVASLVSGRFELVHGRLLGVGLLLILLNHWRAYHHK